MIRRVARCDGRMVCYPNRGVATQIGSTGRCRERLWRQRRGDRPRFRANLRLHSGECHVVTGGRRQGVVRASWGSGEEPAGVIDGSALERAWR